MFTVPASVTSLPYSHRFDSIQILNALIHVICLPSPFGLFFLVIDVFNYGLWQRLGKLSDLSPTSLASKLESTVTASRPPGTDEVKAYRRAFLGGRSLPVPRWRSVCFLQIQSMWLYTYSIYWIPPIPIQRLTLPYM